VKVADLGLARSISAVQPGGMSDEVMGTPAYMSPEQVNGQTDLDCRADIYALGATLYHLISGRMLFTGDSQHLMEMQVKGQAPSLRKVQPHATLAAELLIEKMLAKNRNQRPRDWKETIQDIRRARRKRPPVGLLPWPGTSTMQHDPETPHVLAAADAATPRAPDFRWGWLIAAAIVIFVVAVILGWLLCPNRP
jgi:serine/threonine protein kinase